MKKQLIVTISVDEDNPTETELSVKTKFDPPLENGEDGVRSAMASLIVLAITKAVDWDEAVVLKKPGTANASDRSEDTPPEAKTL